jgi:hypothetical protein
MALQKSGKVSITGPRLTSTAYHFPNPFSAGATVPASSHVILGKVLPPFRSLLDTEEVLGRMSEGGK